MEALPKFLQALYLAAMPPRKPARGRTRLPFVLFKELYTDRCFVDEEILSEHGAGVLRGSFENESQEEVMSMYPPLNSLSYIAFWKTT